MQRCDQYQNDQMHWRDPMNNKKAVIASWQTKGNLQLTFLAAIQDGYHKNGIRPNGITGKLLIKICWDSLKYSETIAWIESLCGRVLVFYCCIRNYQKLSNLKQYTFIISQFLQVRHLSTEQLGPLLSVSHTEIKVSPGVAISFEAQAPLPSSMIFGRVQFFVVVGLRLSISRSHSYKSLKNANYFIGTESKSAIPRKRGRIGRIDHKGQGNILGIVDVFIVLAVVLVSRYSIYGKIHQIIYSK